MCSRPQIHQPCFFVRSIQTSDGQLFEHDHQSDYFFKAGFESATFSQHRLGLFGRPLGPVVDLVRVSFLFGRHVATLNNEGTFPSSQNSRSARARLGPFSFHPSDGSPWGFQVGFSAAGPLRWTLSFNDWFQGLSGSRCADRWCPVGSGSARPKAKGQRLVAAMVRVPNAALYGSNNNYMGISTAKSTT